MHHNGSSGPLTAVVSLHLVLVQGLVRDELAKILTADDASDVIRLILHDAGTYDIATGTGGFNGSIQFE